LALEENWCEMPYIILQTENLTKHYGSLTAVQDLSLQIYEGEVFGFLGPNGAGKTTSINMLCGLLKPDAGSIILHGAPINGGDKRTRALVGMCPQEVTLWERLTCIEQLQFLGQMYGLKATLARQRGQKLLDELDLAEKRDRQARTLSGGMKRRLNLALALVHDPTIVVLDEPEAGLDPQSRVLVREYIHSLARQKTVILTTHNMDEAERLVDRVAIIDHGRLLVLDSPQALKERMGAGDVLEIFLDEKAQQHGQIREALASLGNQVRVEMTPGALTVRALHLISLLPSILQALSAEGIPLGEVRLRQNTLEDVFIQLTGRRLRE
jgi:ABC-2 type transport system ATP-binding protein